MRKVNCIFDSVDEAERAKEKILRECGGDCSITEHAKNSSTDFLIYPIPSNYGMNISPQTPADAGAWQTISPIIHENVEKTSQKRKCILSYIGFDAQAKKAEDLLINLRAEKVRNQPFPKS